MLLENRSSRRRLRIGKWLFYFAGLILLIIMINLTPSARHAASTAFDSAGIDLDEPLLPDIRDVLQDQWYRLADAGFLFGKRPEERVEAVYADVDRMQAPSTKIQQTKSKPLLNHIQTSNALSCLANGLALWPLKSTSKGRSQQHPILTLIDQAQREWSDKLQRESQTLNEAVKEYQRRYHRNPPRGFDRWWSFAVKNNVLLKDEYDQIDRDLRIFRAL